MNRLVQAFAKKTITLKSGVTALLLALVLPTGAQTFNGQGGLLVPPGAPGQTVGITQSPCTVSGIGVLGGCRQVASVTMDINHTFTGDVGILLVAPNGAFLDLTTSNGGAGDNWTNCTFSDAAAAFITTTNPPYTGTWRPEGRATTLNQPYANTNPLGTFTFANTFNGVDADGQWILYVNDYVAADVGIINSWSITFTDTGTPPIAFPASMSACTGANGVATFNLTTLNSTVNGGTGLPVTYYLNSNGTNPIANPSAFTTPVSTVVYAVVMGGCPSEIVPITLTVEPAGPLPGASVTITPPDNCGPVQGTIVFNLGISGPVNITYNLNGPAINQNFSATTNAAGVFTLPYSFTTNLTATLLTASQPGGCAYTFSPISDQFVLLPGPTISVNGPNIFCQGQIIDLSTLVNSTGTVTFHSSNPPTPGNELSNTIVTLQNSVTYYALAQTAGGCSSTAPVPINVQPAVTPMLSSVTICETAGAFDLAALEDPFYPNGTWSGSGAITGSIFNPLGQAGPHVLTFTPFAACALPATTTVTVTPPNFPDLGTATICAASGPFNLTALLDPAFPLGAWSGPGVSGGFFNPGSFNGPVTLTFAANASCTPPVTTQIVVQAAQQPVLGTATLCNTDPPLSLASLADPGFPAGGTWSGPGVSGGFFNPANFNGPISLTFTPTGPGCFAAASTLVNVNISPVIDLDDATICENAGLYNLAQLQDPGFPNGTWSGPGVSGNNFNPLGRLGINTLTFTPNALCGMPVTTTILVSPVQGAPTLEEAELCANAGPLNLTTLQDPAFPTGIWSGPGVSGATFNPANFNGIITLTFTPNQACTSPATTQVEVSPVEQPSLGTAALCANAQPISLTALQDPAFPNGVWSGPGVSGATFNPASLSGQVTVVFTPQGNNCAAASSTMIQVTAPPAPDLDEATLCENEGLYDLGQLLDPNLATGVWSGPGVTGDDFDPQGLTGVNTLTFTPDASCSLSATTTVAVTAPATPTLGTTTVCSSDAPLNLTMLQDPNFTTGVWAGAGVTGSQFNPAGLSGAVTLTYTPAGSCTAPATTTLTVNVTRQPLLSTATLCENSGPFDLSVLVPSGAGAGTWSGPGVTNNLLNPAGLSGVLTLTFAPSEACALQTTTSVTINTSTPPSFNTQFSGTLCTDDCLTAAPTLTGQGPFSLIFEIEGPQGSATDTLQIASSGSNIAICPAEYALGTGDYTMTALQISDANCQQPLDLPLGAFQIVEPMAVVAGTLCPGETLVVGNQTFNETNPSGQVVLTGASALGCDSLVQVSLSFFPVSTGQLSQTLCPGEALTIGNQTFDASNPTGAVVFANASASGCDSTVMVSLSFYPVSTGQLSQTLCPGETLAVGNQTFSASNPTGTVLFANASANGCDSTVAVSLSFFAASTSQLSQTLCPGETLTVGNQTFDASNPNGTVLFANASANGCDSTVNVSVSFFAASTGQLNQTLCPGETLTVGNQTFDASNPNGTVLFANASANGCDSTVNVSVSFFAASTGQLNQTLCPGETLTVGNQTFSSANPTGTVLLPSASINGCDSTVNVSVSFFAASTGQLNQTLCPGETLTVGNQTFSSANPTGAVLLSNASINGCDSTVNVSVSFFAASTGQLNQTLCPGETLTVGNQTFSSANPTGAVLLSNASINGCDSTVNVSVSFFAASTGQLNQMLCPGETLTVGNQTFSSANPTGTVLLLSASINGCDSTVNVSLSFFAASTGQLNQTLCPGETLTVGNQTFSSANPTGAVLLPSASVNGCDSTVNVSVSFFAASTGQLNQTLCPGETLTVGNQTFSSANPTGAVLLSNASVNGCDSTVNVSLSFFAASTGQFSQTLCPGETLTIGNQTFSSSNPTGNVLFSNASVNGCDSTVTVSLSFFAASTGQFNQTLCAGQTLTVGSQTFTSSNPTGNVLFANASANGCDSVVTVSLTFQSVIATDLNEVICEGESYTFNGQVLTAAGTYSGEFTTVSGCDSVVTLNLTIAAPPQIAMDSVFEIVPRQFVTLQPEVNGSVSCNWEPASLVLCSTCCDTRTVSLTRDTTVVLYAIDENGCESSFTVSILARARPGFYVPNVFRPGSPANGYFTLYGTDAIEEIEEMMVFSRWGEPVFERTRFQPDVPQLGWDGTFRGEVLDPGVFVWYARLRLKTGKVIVEKGDVTLLR